MQKFILYSLSWEQSDVKTREAFSFSSENILSFNDRMRSIDRVSEWMVLSTCNRTEILTYGERSSIEEVLTQLAKTKNQSRSATSDVFQVRVEDALSYFAEVTTGLRSQILGDAQILNQVKAAYKFACHNQTAGAYTHRLMQLLFAANKKVATQTNFKTGINSVPYAAIDMAKEYMEMYNEPAIAVIGFGDMSQGICKYLISKGVQRITVFNRSKEKVIDFFSSRPVAYSVYGVDQLSEKLAEYDIVFSAVATTNYIIHPKMVGQDREGFFQLLMDISLPRTIDPMVDKMEGVIRLDMDDIKEVTDASERKKQDSIEPVVNILKEYLSVFGSWASNHQKLEVVRELKHQLYQMDYGKLLALCNSAEVGTNAINRPTSAPFLINKVVKIAVLAIKTPVARQSAR